MNMHELNTPIHSYTGTAHTACSLSHNHQFLAPLSTVFFSFLVYIHWGVHLQCLWPAILTFFKVIGSLNKWQKVNRTSNKFAVHLMRPGKRIKTCLAAGIFCSILIEKFSIMGNYLNLTHLHSKSKIFQYIVLTIITVRWNCMSNSRAIQKPHLLSFSVFRQGISLHLLNVVHSLNLCVIFH